MLECFDRKPPSERTGVVGQCRVCGDDATGMYFGALVCVPCKVITYTPAMLEAGVVFGGVRPHKISTTTGQK